MSMSDQQIGLFFIDSSSQIRDRVVVITSDDSPRLDTVSPVTELSRVRLQALRLSAALIRDDGDEFNGDVDVGKLFLFSSTKDRLKFVNMVRHNQRLSEADGQRPNRSR